MKIYKKSKNKTLNLLIFLGIIFIYIVAGIYIKDIYKYSIIKQVKYIAFIIIYLILPGLFYIKLLKINIEKLGLRFLVAYFIGYSTLIIQYYLLNLLKLFFLIKYISIAVSILYLVLFIINIQQIKVRKLLSDVNLVTLDIGFVFLAIAFMATMVANPHPSISAYSINRQDFIWHIGNINTLSQTFPVQDPRLLNSIFNYHYFNDLLYAIAKVITGLDGFSLIYYYSPLVNIFIFVYSMYYFGLELLKNTKLALAFTLLCTLVGNYDYIFKNTSLYSSVNTYFIQVVTNVNGVTVALPCILILYICIRQYFTLKNNKKKMLIAICILTTLATGLKGPFAVVLVAALIGTLIIIAINRELTKDKIMLGVCTGCSFLFVYKFLLSSSATSASITLNTIFQVVKMSMVGKFTISMFGDIHNYYYILGIPFHFLIAIGVVAIPFILMIFYVIRFLFGSLMGVSKNKLDYDILFSAFIAIIGCSGYYIVYQAGSSQMYFLFVAIPFIVYLSLVYINKHKNKIILTTYLIVGVIIGILTTYNGCKIYAQTGLETYRNQKLYITKAESSLKNIHYNGISRNEYEALIWLKNNTTINDVCSSNRVYLYSIISDNSARFFYYSAISERNFFIEGYNYSYGTISKEEINSRKAYNKKLYEGSLKEKIIVVDKYKINYILVSKFSDYKINDDFSYFNKVYENSDMVIYKANTIPE